MVDCSAVARNSGMIPILYHNRQSQHPLRIPESELDETPPAQLTIRRVDCGTSIEWFARVVWCGLATSSSPAGTTYRCQVFEELVWEDSTRANVQASTGVFTNAGVKKIRELLKEVRSTVNETERDKGVPWAAGPLGTGVISARLATTRSRQLETMMRVRARATRETRAILAKLMKRKTTPDSTTTSRGSTKTSTDIDKD